MPTKRLGVKSLLTDDFAGVKFRGKVAGRRCRRGAERIAIWIGKRGDAWLRRPQAFFPMA
jgi:hypothetical protein